MKFNIFISLQLFCLSLCAQENISLQQLEEVWKKEVQTAKEIRQIYQQHAPASRKELRTWHNCFMLLKSGEYIIRHKGEVQDTKSLIHRIPSISLEDPAVITFMQKYGTEKFVDSYYMLQALKKGETFDAARDGISMSTRFPARPLNHNDCNKLKDIFSRNNPLLHNAYLGKMKFLFQNNGCPKEIAALRPVIESHVENSPLKQEVLKLYTRYESLGTGQTAPLSLLQDADGKTYTFADFKGKVLVVDVWATWCCSCIEKMPKFLQLAEDFKADNNVLFLTVSIDRKNAHAKWLKAIQENNMTRIVNLISIPSKETRFETDYRVVGVPRYFIIDKKGKIVTVFAPSPGKELKELILNTLK